MVTGFPVFQGPLRRVLEWEGSDVKIQYDLNVSFAELWVSSQFLSHACPKSIFQKLNVHFHKLPFLKAI